MQLNIFKSVDELLEALAAYFVQSAAESIADHERFTVALSGGSSPEKLYALLTTPAYRNQVDWTKVFCFMGDERYVPATDPANNFRMISNVLFNPLQIDRLQLFPVNTDVPPEQSAAEYTQTIQNHFGGGPPVFDLVLLGLGDNSHTASLFPFTDILEETSAMVKAVYLSDQKVYRISFTAPLINMAERVAFLVYGSGKAYAVHHVLEGEKNIPLYPAQLIRPASGKISWFLDEPAAANLQTRKPIEE
jgi:6-phosphogluconolactonase